MRKLKKKLAALGVGLAIMASSVMSMSALAVITVDWPGTYAPYTGSFYASTGLLQVSNLRWSYGPDIPFDPSSLNPIKGMEFEFRPYLNQYTGPRSTHDIWSRTTSTSSNLPGAYFEFQPDDDDDVAICCGNVGYVEAEKVYYGYMFMEKQPSFTGANHKYTYENEHGIFAVGPGNVVNDYSPLFAATYNNGFNNAEFGHTYNW